MDQKRLDEFRAKKGVLGRLDHRPDYCTCGAIGRDVLADTLHRLKLAGAKVIGLDLAFETRCPQHDGVLLRALREPGRTILLSSTKTTPNQVAFTDSPSFHELSPPPIVASPVLYNPNGVIRGVRLIQEEGARDDASGDPKIRKVRPPFSAAAYLAYRDRAEELPETVSSHSVRCGDVIAPVLATEHVVLLEPLMLGRPAPTNNSAMLISWAGRIGTFPMYSLEAMRTASPEQLTKWFRGKIVLVGAIDDRQLCPVGKPAILKPSPFIDQTNYEAMAGLEIHANALDTLLQQRFIRPLPPASVWLLMLLVSFLTLVSFRRLPAWKAVVITLGEIGTIVAVADYAIRSDHWVYAFIPSVAIFLSAITGALWGVTEVRMEAAAQASLNEIRNAVMDTVLHDLKQPLAAINALAQILHLQEQADKSTGPELIQRIRQQVQIALDDIEELRPPDPNREMTLDRQSVDVAALVRDLAMAQSLTSTIHAVEVQAPEGAVVVHADPRYLRRALNNLLDNAIKYWPDGGTVVVEIVSEPGAVKIRVIDGGMGIAHKFQASVFERWQRAVPADVDIPGTGIGLFSVKRIIEAHGGTVTLTSAPGTGSTFVISLPLVT